MAGLGRALAEVVLVTVAVAGLTGCDRPASYEPTVRDRIEACEALPLYERRECRDRLPPLHDPIDLRR